LQYIFGKKIDGEYSQDFISSIIPNIFSTLVTIWLVDALLRKKEYRDLEKINSRKSEHINFHINRFVFHLLVSIGELEKEKDATVMMGEKCDFQPAIDKLGSYTDHGINEIFFKAFFSERNHVQFSSHLRESVQAMAENVCKTLHEVYPLPKPEILDFFERDLNNYVGRIFVMAELMDSPERADFANYYSDKEEAEIERKKLITNLSVVMPMIAPSMVKFSDMTRGLIEMSAYAKSNQLFINR